MLFRLERCRSICFAVWGRSVRLVSSRFRISNSLMRAVTCSETSIMNEVFFLSSIYRGTLLFFFCLSAVPRLRRMKNEKDELSTVATFEILPRPVQGLGRSFNATRNYLLSSFASAIRACWPAFEMAFMNASALLGVVALPESMLRNSICLP